MQTPDGKPGHYYVTARDRGRTALLLGPFTQHKPGTLAHRQALGAILACKREVRRRGYTDTGFESYGTCRMPLGGTPRTGKLGRNTIDHT